MAEELLQVRRVSKSYGATRALADVDFTLHPGEVVSVLGENGAGKSTLIKILSGVIAPDRGELAIQGRPVRFARPRDALAAGIAYIPQELSVVGTLTVAENLVLGEWPSRFSITTPGAITRRAREICERGGIDLPLRRRVSSLRLGDLQEIEIAKALARDAKIILLDEPTAALSEAEAANLFARVRSLTARGVGVIFVSHRLDEVVGISDRVCVLRNGRRVADLDGDQVTRDELVRRMVGDTPPEEFTARPPAEGPPVLSLRGLSVAGLPGLHEVDLEVGAAEVVGVYGIRGSGAALVAECLGGEARRPTGAMALNGRAVGFPRSPRAALRLGISYVPPDRKRGGLFPNLSVAQNLGMARLRDNSAGWFLLARRERSEARRVMRELTVKTASERENVMTLSGGNQQKVLIGGRIACARLMLVAQEPTRGVDIGARREIHRHIRGLAAAGLSVLIVTTDVEEVVGVCDRVAVIRDGRLVAEFAGDGLTQARVVAAAAGATDEGRSVA